MVDKRNDDYIYYDDTYNSLYIYCPKFILFLNKLVPLLCTFQDGTISKAYQLIHKTIYALHRVSFIIGCTISWHISDENSS